MEYEDVPTPFLVNYIIIPCCAVKPFNCSAYYSILNEELMQCSFLIAKVNNLTHSSYCCLSIGFALGQNTLLVRYNDLLNIFVFSFQISSETDFLNVPYIKKFLRDRGMQTFISTSQTSRYVSNANSFFYYASAVEMEIVHRVADELMWHKGKTRMHSSSKGSSRYFLTLICFDDWLNSNIR